MKQIPSHYTEQSANLRTLGLQALPEFPTEASFLRDPSQPPLKVQKQSPGWESAGLCSERIHLPLESQPVYLRPEEVTEYRPWGPGLDMPLSDSAQSSLCVLGWANFPTLHSSPQILGCLRAEPITKLLSSTFSPLPEAASALTSIIRAEHSF